jgi:hypothetical protein
LKIGEEIMVRKSSNAQVLEARKSQEIWRNKSDPHTSGATQSVLFQESHFAEGSILVGSHASDSTKKAASSDAGLSATTHDPHRIAASGSCGAHVEREKRGYRTDMRPQIGGSLQTNE